MSGTPSAATIGFHSVTQTIVTACNAKSLSIHQGSSKLLSCGIIDLLCGCSCYLHIGGAFLLRKTLLVDQTNTFVFIHCQNNKVGIFTNRSKL